MSDLRQRVRNGPRSLTPTTSKPAMTTPKPRAQWLIYAIASGGCAALNGVFAKLTTTAQTSHLSSSLAVLLHLSPSNRIIDFLLRALMFGLNLLFNLIMWTLFTRALTLGSSTTRVSIMNTSSNFLVTAVLSALVFSEALPGLWFAGAGLLVVGSVVIGAREEKEGRGPEVVGDGGMAGREAVGGMGLDGVEREDVGYEGYRDDLVELRNER
ncbi:MAG: hypothetical protein M1820_001128 [Bogoriella megaspora]|nr:MAG: hypothetical protein M1820_001128 [Bogoriella megaspora]